MDTMKKKESMFFMTWKRLAKNKLAVAGLIVLIITALLAVFAPIAAPYGYEEQDLFNTLAGPSREHWLGTDNLGRDMLSRLIYGGRNSLTLGLISGRCVRILWWKGGYGDYASSGRASGGTCYFTGHCNIRHARARIYELYSGFDNFPDTRIYANDEGVVSKCSGYGIRGGGPFY